MDQIEQAVMYALGPQVDPSLKAQVNKTIKKHVLFKYARSNFLFLFFF
jgi:hypothetical protein